MVKLFDVEYIIRCMESSTLLVEFSASFTLTCAFMFSLPEKPVSRMHLVWHLQTQAYFRQSFAMQFK